MTPKEKAEELVNKYKPIVTLKMGFEYTYILKKAKEAALIAVDELLDAIDWDYYEGSNHPELDYWREVKQEIELL